MAPISALLALPIQFKTIACSADFASFAGDAQTGVERCEVLEPVDMTLPIILRVMPAEDHRAGYRLRQLERIFAVYRERESTGGLEAGGFAGIHGSAMAKD